MIIWILCAAGYIAIAAACIYLEGLLTGDPEDGPFWLFWPFILPLLTISMLFSVAAKLGKRHRG